MDLGAYLDRIGVKRDAALEDIHYGHVCSIPFENIDPRRGIPVSLRIEDIEQKLVADRRGGYCFEHNLLLKAALEELGHEVEPMLARVRAGGSTGAIRPPTHLVLRVDGEWQADVGFGLGGLLWPIPWGPGEEDQMGWEFEVVEEDGLLVLRTNGQDEYAVIPQAAPHVDIEVNNWYTSTYPSSIFVTGLMIAIRRPDGSFVSLSDRTGTLMFNETTTTGTTSSPVGEEEFTELLALHFGLQGQ